MPQPYKRPRPPRRFVAAAALVIVACSAVAGTQVSTASASDLSANLIAALPAPQCRTGEKALNPVSAQVTAHGATVYHYAEGFDAYLPPAGFSPVKADDATLAEMNLPSRPTDAADLTA